MGKDCLRTFFVCSLIVETVNYDLHEFRDMQELNIFVVYLQEERIATAYTLDQKLWETNVLVVKGNLCQF